LRRQRWRRCRNRWRRRRRQRRTCRQRCRRCRQSDAGAVVDSNVGAAAGVSRGAHHRHAHSTCQAIPPPRVCPRRPPLRRQRRHCRASGCRPRRDVASGGSATALPLTGVDACGSGSASPHPPPPPPPAASRAATHAGRPSVAAAATRAAECSTRPPPTSPPDPPQPAALPQPPPRRRRQG